MERDRRPAPVAGALLKRLDAASQRYGVVCPNGAVSHTAVAASFRFLNQNITP